MFFLRGVMVTLYIRRINQNVVGRSLYIVEESSEGRLQNSR
ncbi:MAG: hypothetical protein WD355_07600 [Balneolaceae bacterium]